MACLVVTPLVLAADKSGVSPNTISLPKGPGSIEGLGESFQPTLNTGTAKYGITLKLPPGTAGHAPDLRLAYEGGGGNGPLGFGWQLPLACVQRRSDGGIPTYGADMGFAREDVFINEMKEELVPTTNGFHFCKNEGAFIRYRRVGSHWEGTLPDGTRIEFGLTAAARIEDTATARVFAWLLERETDTRGNTIVYSYVSFPGQQNMNQKYLSAVRYGPGAPPWSNFHFAAFQYEDRPDWFEDCRAGFAVRTGKRLRSVFIGTQGPALDGHLAGDFDGDGSTDYLNRRYDFAYVAYAGTNSHWSLLGKLTMVGADGVTALPPALFGYTICHPPTQLSAADQEIGGINEPPFVMDNALVDLADLNGDGFPDLLKSGGPAHQAYLNLGETNAAGARAILWTEPMEVASDSGDAWTFSLSSASTHLADMDGDGLADLVNKAAEDNVFYFANRGRSAWGERQPMSVESVPPPAPFGTPNVRTADVDFDKRTDLIRGDGLEYQVWFNLGGDRYSERVTVPNDAGFDFSLMSVQVADWNGDRVPDLCRVRPTGIEVTAGFGYGHFAAPGFVALLDHTLDAAQTDKAKLTDLNGDGLADLVLERADPGELWFWLNLGNYSLSARHVITGMPSGIGPNATIRWADLNGNGTTDLIYADGESSPRLRTVDIGDLIGCGATPNMLVTISNGIGRATLIGHAPSTIFARQDAAMGQAWPDVMPFPVSVVAAVTNLDSLGHAYVTRFRYHDGYYDPGEKQFRGFARVEQVDIGDATAPTLVTRSHFDTGRNFEAMKGRLLRLTAEQEDGRAFWDESHSWSTPPRVLLSGTNGSNVVYVHPTARARTIKELGQGTERRLESEFAYDNYGNQTTDANYGIVTAGDRSAFNDERVSVTEYAINLNAWLLRLPARQVIQDEHGLAISKTEFFYDDETFAGNNFGQATRGDLTMKREWIDPASPSAFVKTARTKFDAYGNPVTLLDPLAVAPGGAIDFGQGHLRQIAYDSRFRTYPTTETIHVGNGSAPLIFQAGYDEGLGTLTASEDFNANRTTYGYDVLARLTSIVKPGDTPAYPTVEYDYALAVPVAGNGLVNHIETRQLDRTPGTAGTRREHFFISRQIVDGLGRNLMTKQEAGAETEGGALRVSVRGAVMFNARQKPFRTLTPFYTQQGSGDLDSMLAYEDISAPGWTGAFQDQGSLARLNLASAHQSLTRYDATLREAEVENPDHTLRRTVYEPLATRSFDENDTDPASPHADSPTVHHQDGLGRLDEVNELARLNDDGTVSGAIRTWVTRYEYDLNDQLTRIIDSQNNVKTFAYDGLRRKKFMNDPDRGVMHWMYDDASNLKESTDAKGQRITYTYDGANRLLTENYHDGLPPPPWRSGSPLPGGEGFGVRASLTNSIIYHYDVPFPNLPQGDNTAATARNVKGMLTWVEDLSGEEHTSFDSRGRVEWTVKHIPDPQFLSLSALGGEGRGEVALISYKTSFAYDSLDRVTRLTYPDNDEVSYRYAPRNQLERIVGGPSSFIISNLLYWPSDQQQQIDYGNGVRTTYAHDSRLRLKTLLTVGPALTRPAATHSHPMGEGLGERELIHFAYDFDAASNIKTIEDRRPGSVMPSGDPRRNTQLFGYDDLYRLTRAQYSFNLPGTPVRNDGEIHYRYDRVGNMLAQTSTLNQQENGLPVANLGEMESGGAAGRWNRTGRAANDPPGPHALTRISNPPSQIPDRIYPYDANGNMTVIDGLTNTWDFKDRLVAVENNQMRAEYAYDYTDRRIVKRVIPKLVGTGSTPTQTNSVTDAVERVPTSVVYVNKYFEVREHDAPTKYVWNGNTRVARVTGSLSANLRVQRLRVWPGWNLCSIALDGARLPSSPDITAAYQWNRTSQNWDPLPPNSSLAAGTVLWLKATNHVALPFTGTYSEPTDPTVLPGGDFLASAGLEVWDLKSALSNQTAGYWTYDAFQARWLSMLPAPLDLPSAAPALLAPGDGVFIRAGVLPPLRVPESAHRIHYYHQDHLGSSSVVADGLGMVTTETAYQPFGQPRLEYLQAPDREAYKLTQKERDQETGAYYFEARYLTPFAGRFFTVDPLAKEAQTTMLSTRPPSASHSYAYCRNNPLRFSDPTGLVEDEETRRQMADCRSIAPGTEIAPVEWTDEKGATTALAGGRLKSGSCWFSEAIATVVEGVSSVISKLNYLDPESHVEFEYNQDVTTTGSIEAAMDTADKGPRTPTGGPSNPPSNPPSVSTPGPPPAIAGDKPVVPPATPSTPPSSPSVPQSGKGIQLIIGPVEIQSPQQMLEPGDTSKRIHPMMRTSEKVRRQLAEQRSQRR